MRKSEFLKEQIKQETDEGYPEFNFQTSILRIALSLFVKFLKEIENLVTSKD